MDIPRTADGLPNGIPASLSRLKELALNLWWSWTPEARRLFEHIDPTLWVLTHHNPVKLLADVHYPFAVLSNKGFDTPIPHSPQ